MSDNVFPLVEVLSGFAFYYPLFMAYLWLTGAVFFYYRFERTQKGKPDTPPVLQEYPMVTVIVPCYNEGKVVYETVEYLLASTYPNFDILLVDDGSVDDTPAVLEALAAQHPKVRTIHFAQNQGKAVALNTATLMTSAEFVACIDADGLLDPDALTWMMAHMVYNPRTGAVTGNPRVRNRSTLLGRIQLGEFSSIVGLIKRAQRTYGRMFTVSGVCACFRKAAVHDVGYWKPGMLTEDIDISWELQIKHWDVRFEPKARIWILAPETLKGLWAQRLRWAMGGIQVLRKDWRIMRVWKSRRMWPILFEFVTSVAWAYSFLIIAIIWFLGIFVELPPGYRVQALLRGWNGVVVGTTCLLQIGVSMMLDSKYDKRLLRNYFWMIWYPLAYWMLNMATTVVAVPRALFRSPERRARWTSPDRSILR
jgi:biofilm PGA synthesis N-glycosyltransferase PgaC